MPNEKALWGSAQIFPVSVIVAAYWWLREMPHPEHERIKISDPDDASHQHFFNYYKKASKQIFWIWSTLQWGWDIQNTLWGRVYAGIISKHQLNMNHICFIFNQINKKNVSAFTDAGVK